MKDMLTIEKDPKAVNPDMYNTILKTEDYGKSVF